jgi:hypothetical protein
MRKSSLSPFITEKQVTVFNNVLQSHGEPHRYIAIGGLLSILTLMFHSTMERSIQVPANAFLYAVMWAMVFRIATDPQIITRGDQTRNRQN